MKRAAKRPTKSSSRRRDAPIELYYWPTPNGWKISIMLEECALPYVVRPVDISKGEQFTPQFLAISPNNRIPAIVDPAGPGGRSIPVFSPAPSCNISGARPESFIRSITLPGLGRSVAVLADGRARTDGGQAHHFRQYAPVKISSTRSTATATSATAFTA